MEWTVDGSEATKYYGYTNEMPNYSKVLAEQTIENNYRIQLVKRWANYCGPKYFVRVDNGRDVLEVIDYYELNDAQEAFKTELVYWRQITQTYTGRIG